MKPLDAVGVMSGGTGKIDFYAPPQGFFRDSRPIRLHGTNWFCDACHTELEKTSGGKLQCRKCGFMVTCCD